MARMLLPSAELQNKVAELNAMIRRECGNGDYILAGRGFAATLIGCDGNEIDGLAQRVQIAPPAPRMMPPRIDRRQIMGARIGRHALPSRY